MNTARDFVVVDVETSGFDPAALGPAHREHSLYRRHSSLYGESATFRHFTSESATENRNSHLSAVTYQDGAMTMT